MTTPLEKLNKMLYGKTVSIIGIGVSNSPLIKLLSDMNIKLIARDKRPCYELGDIYTELSKKGVHFILGEGYLDNLNEDIVFKTPGMRYDTPELVSAEQRGSLITSEMEVFFDLCPADIIGVTGSDGKTTTTTIIYTLLQKQGYTCWLGGNIGTPLIHKLDEIHPNDKVVLELSSFQLHTMKASPRIAVITNISPNHLDIHKSMDEYVEAKINIMLNQDARCKLVVNADNSITSALIDSAKAEICPFSRSKNIDNGVCLSDGSIYSCGEYLMNINEIKLPGIHNVENYMAAIGAVWGYVEKETIIDVARTFCGVEHRLEFVRELDGVRYYNDSKATTPASARAGICSFNDGIILIAGGYDKHLPFDEFGEYVANRVKKLILLGQTAKDIENAVKKAEGYDPTQIDIHHCADLKSCVALAYGISQPNDIVLLSPACASFDMFPNFEVRGRNFKQLVNSL